MKTQRAVSSEQILQAADAVASQHGISGLTIRRICAELGITSPAVYRHFASKDLIVDELIDRILARTELPGPDVGDWVECLRFYYLSVHDAVAPYAGLAARIARGFPTGPAAERNTNYITELYEFAGLTLEDETRSGSSLFFYVWGHLLASEAMLLDDRTSRDAFLWGLDRLLEAIRGQFFVPHKSTGSSNGNQKRSKRPVRLPPN